MELENKDLEEIVGKSYGRFSKALDFVVDKSKHYAGRVVDYFRRTNRWDLILGATKTFGNYGIIYAVNENGDNQGIYSIPRQLAFHIPYSILTTRIYRGFAENRTERSAVYPRFFGLFALNVFLFYMWHSLTGTPHPGETMIYGGALALGVNWVAMERQLYITRNGNYVVHTDQES